MKNQTSPVYAFTTGNIKSKTCLQGNSLDKLSSKKWAGKKSWWWNLSIQHASEEIQGSLWRTSTSLWGTGTGRGHRREILWVKTQWCLCCGDWSGRETAEEGTKLWGSQSDWGASSDPPVLTIQLTDAHPLFSATNPSHVFECLGITFLGFVESRGKWWGSGRRTCRIKGSLLVWGIWIPGSPLTPKQTMLPASLIKGWTTAGCAVKEECTSYSPDSADNRRNSAAVCLFIFVFPCVSFLCRAQFFKGGQKEQHK